MDATFRPRCFRLEYACPEAAGRDRQLLADHSHFAPLRLIERDRQLDQPLRFQGAQRPVHSTDKK